MIYIPSPQAVLEERQLKITSEILGECRRAIADFVAHTYAAPEEPFEVYVFMDEKVLSVTDSKILNACIAILGQSGWPVEAETAAWRLTARAQPIGGEEPPLELVRTTKRKKYPVGSPVMLT